MLKKQLEDAIEDKDSNLNAELDNIKQSVDDTKEKIEDDLGKKISIEIDCHFYKKCKLIQNFIYQAKLKLK